MASPGRAGPAVREPGGVVLLHGIARTSRTMEPLRRGLDRAGFRTLNLDYRSRHKPLEDLARDIHGPVGSFAVEIAGPLHFVAHSMGGLLVRAYIELYRPAALGRVVMLAPPNKGSEVADLLHRRRLYRVIFGPAGQQLTTMHCVARPGQHDLLGFELGVVAGDRTLNPLLSTFVLPRPNDGKVSVSSTKLAGMADHVTLRASHAWLVRDHAAVEQTVAFLRRGRFLPSAGGP